MICVSIELVRPYRQCNTM